MYSPTDLRKDTLIEYEGAPHKVIEYAQKQLGRGGSIVNTKLKNMLNGSVIDVTFRNDQKINPAVIERQTVQYLYSDNASNFVMNTISFETIEVSKKVDSKLQDYLLEGTTIDALIFEEKIIGFEWPKNVVLKVNSAVGADKGNSASATTKEVELETGIKIQAPQFVKAGDSVKVDTRTSKYLERVT